MQAKGVGFRAGEFLLGNAFLGFLLDVVESADAGEDQMSTRGVAVLGVVKMTARVRPAAEFEDVAVRKEMVVDVVGVGIEIALEFAVNERIDALGGVIAGEAEEVEGMIAIADEGPHLAGHGLAFDVGIEIGHFGGVGVHGLRAANERAHEQDDGAKHAGDVGHPIALGGASEIDAVPREDAFEAMQRQMVGVFASGDLGQKAGAGQSLVDDGDGDRSRGDMVMTLLAGVFEADVLADEKVGGLVIELLADLLAEFLTDDAAAGAESFGFRKREFDAKARQILGQRLSSMAIAFGLVVRGGIRCRIG